MARLTFGFHTSVTGPGVPQAFYQTLDAAGIPFFAKASDTVPYDAQLIAKNSSVPHVVIARVSLHSENDPCPSGNPDVPDYNKAPRDAAIEHWNWHKRQLIRMGVDPAVTWVETINEVDKNRAEWLAEFALETANLTMGDGYKWLAFGWATGEPEPVHWQGPKMRQFLDLVAANPDKLGIALHEYSLSTTNIMNGDGWLIGRYTRLLEVNPRVNVYMTEWGWNAFEAPTWHGGAMSDILQVGAIYARTPQVKGAAIWALNGGWNNISQTVQEYITPLLQLTLETVFEDPTPPPPPVGNHKAIVVKLYQDATREEWLNAAGVAYDYRHTMTASHDDTIRILTGGNEESFVKFSHPERDRETIALVEAFGYRWEPLYTTPPPSPIVHLRVPNIYSQRDPRWASKCIGVCPNNRTIGGWGCLLVAYNMQAQYMNLTTMRPDQYNDHMVAMGCFSGPYLLAGALRTAHPNRVEYHGYLGRGDALNAKIKEWLDLGIPVPIRVDFNPTTIPWEQHWVLAVGYTRNDFIIVDPWHGDEIYLADRYNIPGNDVLEGLFYKPRPSQGEPINLLSFMRADPFAWRVVRHSSGAQEDFRDYHYPNSQEWAMVKNGAAPQHEQIAEFWAFDDNFIYLKQDTSPDPDSQGTPRLYKVEPGRYARRVMRVGDVYHDGGHYVQFYAKSDCRMLPENSGHSSNNTRVLKLERNYRFNRYGQNIVLDEVLFLQGNSETQVFARHQGRALGRVAWASPWGDSEIVELYFDRGQLTMPPRRYCS